MGAYNNYSVGIVDVDVIQHFSVMEPTVMLHFILPKEFPVVNGLNETLFSPCLYCYITMFLMMMHVTHYVFS